MFSIGFSRVEEFAGTGSALRLAGDITGMAGCLGIGGYHLGGTGTLTSSNGTIK